MPRNRPGKKERAVKRIQDQRALDEFNDRIHAERASSNQHTERVPSKQQIPSKTTGDDRVKKSGHNNRTYTSTEVDAIVQAAVTAAVTTTVATTKALLSGDVPKQSITTVKPARTLAERITSKPNDPTKNSLADRITFPKKK
jgi:hypothetical protein